MNIQAQHQDFLTAHGLFVLDQLPDDIQQIAIQNVMDAEHKGFIQDIANARAAIKKDLHACINNSHFIRELHSNRSKLKCPKYRRSFVLNNLCEFRADGTYYTYADIEF
ncbi:hypothetical protein [Acinetobacter sp. 10FS3-1]|uniref:Uncharacterized protein n=2 Tax=Acinetobacter indicus TaxID=756892 RepID=A0A6C0Y923_9GAMM|nr:hypothetical protein [Acinetobacter sp. 10FS3-1]QIC72095.1 hypothetical protein FSC09_17200 [Acinetobacter indicus]